MEAKRAARLLAAHLEQPLEVWPEFNPRRVPFAVYDERIEGLRAATCYARLAFQTPAYQLRITCHGLRTAHRRLPSFRTSGPTARESRNLKTRGGGAGGSKHAR
ncbi:hypothetical protein [Oceanithermus desulfurans]|uniref:Uncharacterized protein n=2 Tax=Oceanithermus desulfurans TaxID=227924 RepID=A0A511RJ47_9DEIN|nr:hypothetical protein [Oceanithermus desulfurans]MBB6029630.1 hypothetical protein [Oceanithermus desulfurans]GEM89675.1 hypothetical protein ODE01S_11090 [Oceanithermus desulfurans NBRC 100063]